MIKAIGIFRTRVDGQIVADRKTINVPQVPAPGAVFINKDGKWKVSATDFEVEEEHPDVMGGSNETYLPLIYFFKVRE